MSAPETAIAARGRREHADTHGSRDVLTAYKTVVLAVPTITGLPRGKSYDREHFTDHVLKEGTHAAAYLLSTDVDMRMLPGFSLGGWEHGAGDLVLRPDLATLRPDPRDGHTALVFGDAYDHSDQLIGFAPRAVLAAQISRLAGLGLTASLGIESEAMVYDIDYRDAARRGWRDLPDAADYNGDYGLAHPPRMTALIGGIRRAVLASRLPLEAIKTEAGRGQLEVTFRHGEPMAAADAHLVYKLLAHHAAEELGMAVTFMAKPFTGIDGNSCHLHLSVLNGHQVSILVADNGRLTKTGRRAVAGCLAVLDQLAVLMLPTVNSYKRLHTEAPPLFAPTTLTWGYDNRTCALRVLGAGPSGRIECRIPGADAQPHLAAAALFAAVAYGIEHGLELEDEPVAGNAYQSPRARLLPRTLDDASSLLQSSNLAISLLGADVIAHYATASRHESDYHKVRVSDLERERGFARA